MKYSKIKHMAKSLALIAGGIGLMMAEPALAKTVGDVAGNLTTSTNGVVKAVGAISSAAGFIMALIGALKFKAHKDNPQQTPISVPIIYLVVASLLLFLPTLIQTGADTIWGTGGATSQGLDGSNMGNGF